MLNVKPSICPICGHHRASNHHKALNCRRKPPLKDTKPDNSPSTKRKYLNGTAFSYLT